jgi:hypothetical protein
MFFVALAVQTSFFSSPPCGLCWPCRDSICPSATNHPSFRSLLILWFRRVRYRRKGFPSPDWTALSFHFLLWISGLGIFFFSPFPRLRVYTLKLAINFSDNDRHHIDRFILFIGYVIVKYQLINYLMTGIFQ